MAEGKSYVRQIKGALLLIGILVLGSVVAFFLIHQQKTSSDQPGGAAIINQKATISLEGVHHWAIKNGDKDWSLDAESADYQLEDSKAVFRNPRITFFNEKGDAVLMSADSGILHTNSNDLDVIGHVMVENSEYELQTDNLTYIHDKRMCITQAPVVLTSEVFKITADNMEYDLGKGIIHFGYVAGVIDEDIGI